MASSSLLSSSPATAALDMLEQQSKLTAASRGGASHSLSKLSFRLCDLNFDDDHHDESPIESFPVIEWDANDDDSEASDGSVKSLDTWNSIFHSNDFGSSSSLGKRTRDGSEYESSPSSSRRLVRSKKIKSNLSSLAVISFAARSA